jgi:hypothetical protein
METSFIEKMKETLKGRAIGRGVIKGEEGTNYGNALLPVKLFWSLKKLKFGLKKSIKINAEDPGREPGGESVTTKFSWETRELCYNEAWK